MKYNIIYCDPPWYYNNRTRFNKEGKLNKFGYGAVNHYPTMNTEDICSLKMDNISDKNCMLFLWGTWPHLPDSLKVIESWGFKYKTVGFVWVKINKKGIPYGSTGYYTKSNSEFCLLATKGKPFKVSDYVSQIIMAPRTKHSEKPAEVRDKIVQLCGDIPRVELFARESVEGWDSIGNEINGKNIKEVLENWRIK